MAKKKHEAHINHERWMVSFADFMTLMFAVFVVLFSMSTIDQIKLKKLVVSVQKAFGVLPSYGAGLMQNDPGEPGPINLIPVIFQHNPQMAALEKQVKKTVNEDAKLKGVVQLRYESRGLIIQLKDSRLFDSGSSQLRPEIMPALTRLVKQHLVKLTNQIRIEGHTDNVPMAGGVSNWELSAARAATVLRFMRQISPVSPNRLSLAGYGEYRPIASNATEAGRARNRRVDIVILSPTENEKEPVSAGSAGVDNNLNTTLNTKIDLENRRR